MFRLLLERKWLEDECGGNFASEDEIFSDSLKDENRMKAAECGNRKRLQQGKNKEKKKLHKKYNMVFIND